MSVASVGPYIFTKVQSGYAARHILSCRIGITSPANRMSFKYSDLTLSSTPEFAALIITVGTQNITEILCSLR